MSASRLYGAERRAQRRAAHRRPVHLDRLYALGPRHPLSPPQGGERACPRRLRSGEPFRQGARSTCSRPIRATSSSRSTRTRSTTSPPPSWRSRSGRACASLSRPRQVRPLRLGHRLRAARPLRQRRPRGDRRLSRRGLRRATSRPSIRPSRKGTLTRVHFIIGRDGGDRRRSGPRDARGGGRAIIRDWADGLDAALAATHEPAAAKPALGALRGGLPGGLPRRFHAGGGARRHRALRAADRRAPACRRLPSDRRRAAMRRSALKLVHLGSADRAVRARADAREHGLPRHRRAHLRGAARRRARPIHLHDMALESMSGAADRPRGIAASV